MREAERKRLVKLIKEAHKKSAEAIHEHIMDTVKTKGRFNSKTDGDRQSMYEMEADYLLENGVIVPPCKAGNTLYFLYNRPYANRPDLEPRIYETNNWYFDIDKNGVSILTRSIHGYNGRYHYYLGKTVFLTKEEAEQALKDGEE